jgi:hypothetical protein
MPVNKGCSDDILTNDWAAISARNKPATPRRRARYAESTRRNASAAEVRASCAGEHVAMEL